MNLLCAKQKRQVAHAWLVHERQNGRQGPRHTLVPALWELVSPPRRPLVQPRPHSRPSSPSTSSPHAVVWSATSHSLQLDRPAELSRCRPSAGCCTYCTPAYCCLRRRQPARSSCVATTVYYLAPLPHLCIRFAKGSGSPIASRPTYEPPIEIPLRPEGTSVRGRNGFPIVEAPARQRQQR